MAGIIGMILKKISQRIQKIPLQKIRKVIIINHSLIISKQNGGLK